MIHQEYWLHDVPEATQQSLGDAAEVKKVRVTLLGHLQSRILDAGAHRTWKDQKTEKVLPVSVAEALPILSIALLGIWGSSLTELSW